MTLPDLWNSLEPGVRVALISVAGVLFTGAIKIWEVRYNKRDKPVLLTKPDGEPVKTLAANSQQAAAPISEVPTLVAPISTGTSTQKSWQQEQEEIKAKWKDSDPFTSIEAFYLKLESFGRRLPLKNLFINENTSKEVRWKGQVTHTTVDRTTGVVAVSFDSEELESPHCDTYIAFHRAPEEIVQLVTRLHAGDVVEVIGKLTSSPGTINGLSLRLIRPGPDGQT